MNLVFFPFVPRVTNLASSISCVCVCVCAYMHTSTQEREEEERMTLSLIRRDMGYERVKKHRPVCFHIMREVSSGNKD